MEWSSNSKKNGNVTFTSCICNGKPLTLRLDDACIQYEPSVFGGDGTETRKNLVLTVSDDTRQKIEAMEANLPRTSLPMTRISCLKENNIKCKIDMTKVRCFDAARNPIEQPLKWRGLICNAQLCVNGKWQTANSVGLSISCTDLQILEQASPIEPCPF